VLGCSCGASIFIWSKNRRDENFALESRIVGPEIMYAVAAVMYPSRHAVVHNCTCMSLTASLETRATTAVVDLKHDPSYKKSAFLSRTFVWGAYGNRCHLIGRWRSAGKKDSIWASAAWNLTWVAIGSSQRHQCRNTSFSVTS
jgi:hypothetical protein